MAATPSNARPWWLAPGPVAFGVLILAACGAVVMENRGEAAKPVDVRDRVVLPGGATFCDTVPLPPSKRVEGTAVPPPPLTARNSP